MDSKIFSLLVAVLLTFALLCGSIRTPGAQWTVGAYATDLAGRTPNQQFNARRAAELLNGAVILPGYVFSFNQRLGGWSRQKGYRKAPVSYNGILVDDYGGGVCQTSTTLYNAALLSGLPIVERHSHTFAPSYAPPGRDAAVAYENVDLRFKNSCSTPLVIRAIADGSYVTCSIIGFKKPIQTVTVDTALLNSFPAPVAPVQLGSGRTRSRWHIRGRRGVRVATYRSYFDVNGQLLRTQLVSDNTYRPISAAVWAQ